MGSHLLLYYSVDAASVVPRLNDAWAANDLKFGTLKSTVSEIPFISKRHADMDPTVHSVNHLNYYLVVNNYLPFGRLFGFTEPETDRPYLIPDWTTTLQNLTEHLDFLALDLEKTPGGITPLAELLDSFKEMAEWVLLQPGPNHYFVEWSW